MADLLSDENEYSDGPHTQDYKAALQQYRFRIRQGQIGLTVAALKAPAALSVALRESSECYSLIAARRLHQALCNAPWLFPNSSRPLRIRGLFFLLPFYPSL